MFERKLRALKYPRWKNVNISDAREFRTLVVWLEETKIRYYPMEKRSHLRLVDSTDWGIHFAAYMKELQCPHSCSGSLSLDQTAYIVEWLLGQAISAEYHDAADKYNNIDKASFLTEAKPVKSAGTVEEKISVTQRKAMDCSGPDFFNAINKIAELFNLPRVKNEASAAALLKEIRHRVQKAVAKRSDQKSEGIQILGKRKEVEESDIAAYKLGFQTTDPLVDKAAMILRLLHLHDLRDLQTIINEVIVCAQNITADPKTDSKLGRVGRGGRRR